MLTLLVKATKRKQRDMYLNQYPVKEGSNLGWNIHIPTSHGWNTADQLIDVSWFFSLPNSFYYQENKLLLICINFTPKTSHNCQKNGTFLSRYISPYPSPPKMFHHEMSRSDFCVSYSWAHQPAADCQRSQRCEQRCHRLRNAKVIESSGKFQVRNL